MANGKIGSVTHILALKHGFISHANYWRWKRVFFKSLVIGRLALQNQNMLITGSSGSGKSNACKLIVKALADQGSKVIVLDSHNEYIDLAGEIGAKVHDASKEAVNVLEMQGTSKEKASEISNMLRTRLRLGYRQYNELYRLLLYTYQVCEKEGKRANMQELLYSLQVFKKNAVHAELGTLQAIESRLALLGTSARKELGMDELMYGSSIYALAGLHNSEAQAVYEEALLRSIYANMLKQRQKGRLYVVIEEAEKLEHSSILARLAAEGRKYGIGIIAVSQRAKAIDKELRSNAGMVIAFSTKEPEELNYVANMLACGNELGRFIQVKKALRSLKRGHAIALAGEQPMLIRLRQLRLHENCEYMLMRLLESARSKGEIMQALQGCESAEELLEQKLASGEVKHYQASVPGQEQDWYIAKQSSENSAEHDIMLELIRRKLESQGIRAEIRNRAYEPDIVAWKEGEQIAIEYETGKKAVMETAKMLENRLGTFGKVIVIVSDNAQDFAKGLAEIAGSKAIVMTAKAFFEHQL
ncbi:MAG: ATP-binding protein [Candidatus Micrarchaeia archaeon]